MKHNVSSNGLGAGFLTLLAVGILLGLLLILLPVAFLMKVFFVVIGVVVLITSIPGITAALRILDTGIGKMTLVTSLLSALVGAVLIFSHSKLLMIIVGIYMVVLPVMQILLTRGKASAWKAELPKIIVGCILLLLGPATALEMMFDIAGWVTIGLTLLLAAVFAIATIRRNAAVSKKTGGRMFVDSDGDGSIDTVYVDVDGDGEHDIAKRYRNGR